MYILDAHNSLLTGLLPAPFYTYNLLSAQQLGSYLLHMAPHYNSPYGASNTIQTPCLLTAPCMQQLPPSSQHALYHSPLTHQPHWPHSLLQHTELFPHSEILQMLIPLWNSSP